MHTVKAQKMRICFHRSQIVDRHNLDIGAPRFNDGRKTLRPMRPNPLMATLTAMVHPFDFC